MCRSWMRLWDRWADAAAIAMFDAVGAMWRQADGDRD